MTIQIKFDHQDYSIPSKDQQTILESCLENEIEIPYACESGSCGTCKAKLISGKIELLENNALDDDELDQNFILTCQAVPQSDCSIQIQE